VLAALALAGRHHVVDQQVGSRADITASHHFSAPPAPEPSLPSAVGEILKAPTLSPTPLPSGSLRHHDPTGVSVADSRQRQRTALSIHRPRSFPLLI
jgi:hypothetical protein